MVDRVTSTRWPLRADLTEGDIAAAAARYAGATPFPHVVLDEWFDDAALRHIAELFDRPHGWRAYEDGKRANGAVIDDPVVAAFNEAPMRELLRRIAGGAALLPDPTLRGGGLHAVGRGGRLGIHTDFNRHPDLPLARAVNTIIYLNREWSAEWRGQLTLTDRGEITRNIDPLWNRWVVFCWGEDSWHGHPEPLACPEGVERRSLAIYYYRALPDDAPAFHTTRYA